uniref:hypothetical protein n=1 Tax=Stenotrophomonas cyclobalanopsidis TaxID=2771362 RepID=UPI003F59C070
MTLPAGGGTLPLRLSLTSTLVLLLAPGASGVALKSSSTAIRVPALTLMVAPAVLHSALSGAGRQAW